MSYVNLLLRAIGGIIVSWGLMLIKDRAQHVEQPLEKMKNFHIAK